MTPLKAIFFDIDDTLFSTADFTRRARINALSAMRKAGLKASLKDLSREFEEVVKEFTTNYEQHFDKLLLRLPPEATQGINPAVLVAGAVVAYHDTKFRELKPYPDALTMFRALARTPLVRGIITAGLAVKQAEKLVRLKLYEYLTPSAIFISDQVGIAKPNPKLFIRAIEACGVKAEESIYVGNSWRNDIGPASSIGMTTVLSLRGARDEDPSVKPDYTISTFEQFLDILKRDFRMHHK